MCCKIKIIYTVQSISCLSQERTLVSHNKSASKYVMVITNGCRVTNLGKRRQVSVRRTAITTTTIITAAAGRTTFGFCVINSFLLFIVVHKQTEKHNKCSSLIAIKNHRYIIDLLFSFFLSSRSLSLCTFTVLEIHILTIN